LKTTVTPFTLTLLSLLPRLFTTLSAVIHCQHTSTRQKLKIVVVLWFSESQKKMLKSAEYEHIAARGRPRFLVTRSAVFMTHRLFIRFDVNAATNVIVFVIELRDRLSNFVLFLLCRLYAIIP
jgi:hypothetical protein